jgi:hypothetical protein
MDEQRQEQAIASPDPVRSVFTSDSSPTAGRYRRATIPLFFEFVWMIKATNGGLHYALIDVVQKAALIARNLQKSQTVKPNNPSKSPFFIAKLLQSGPSGKRINASYFMGLSTMHSVVNNAIDTGLLHCIAGA